MMGYACSEEGVLPGDGEFDPAQAGTEISSLSSETSMLRRAHYANDIWHEKIISHNLRLALVDNIAGHYVGRGVALSGLLKAGNQGLTHALENFELEGGSRFSTYAARCIRQNIERAIMSQPGVIRYSSVPEITLLPMIADSNLHRRSILGRGVKTHH